ncbi:MAG TPA: FAD-dependent oxidoreductase, partial [Anaeromyxobacteraceae bacterium]|nr:FAD-dependent oxidoreductase [Anaeromyxobacteraceae bacterium]
MAPESFEAKSFWMTTRPYRPGPPLQGDLEVDVAVVGGGFTGLAAAYFLKRDEPGLRVALLEGEVIGFGASGRNGGFNMTLFGLTLSITALRFGKARAREAHHYMERAVDALRDLVRDLKLDCDYEHPGFLRVATSESYRKRILHEIELAHRLGLSGIEWIDAERLAQEVRSPQYLGAWWEPRCGLLNPAKQVRELKRVAAQFGAHIYENTPVTAIARGARFTLRTPGGTVRAERIAFTVNAYSHLFPQLRRRQMPAFTYMIATAPLTPAQLEPIGWKGLE